MGHVQVTKAEAGSLLVMTSVFGINTQAFPEGLSRVLLGPLASSVMPSISLSFLAPPSCPGCVCASAFISPSHQSSLKAQPQEGRQGSPPPAASPPHTALPTHPSKFVQLSYFPGRHSAGLTGRIFLLPKATEPERKINSEAYKKLTSLSYFYILKQHLPPET